MFLNDIFFATLSIHPSRQPPQSKKELTSQMSSREIEKGLVVICLNFDFFIRANSGRRKCNNNYTLQRRGRFIGEGPPAETTRHIRIKREVFFFVLFVENVRQIGGRKTTKKMSWYTQNSNGFSLQSFACYVVRILKEKNVRFLLRGR